MTVQEIISQFSRYRQKFNNIDITQMCGFRMGTTITKLQTTNPIVFVLYNQQIELAATDDITVTACSVQSVASFCYYLFSVDILSNFTVTKGVDNTYALPITPAGTVPIGAFLINTGPSTTFTAGTTGFNASGITATFFDIDAGITLGFINLVQKRLERGVTIVRNGRQRTIINFDYMLVRASAISLLQGDSSVLLPFPNFKEFVDGGINLTDSFGLTTQLEKEDTVPTGIPFQLRPIKISQRIKAETVFTPDGFPGMEFDLWPICDQAYTLDVQAYQYSPPLDGVLYSNNWLTDNAPEILLFGALSESSLFFGADSSSKEWEARWQEAVWTLYASQEKEKYAGSFIHTRFPNPIGKRGGMGISSNKAGIMTYGFINNTD